MEKAFAARTLTHREFNAPDALFMGTGANSVRAQNEIF